MKLHQAVILAGGMGTRMQPYTLTTPKPMVFINGKPFLQYVIEELKENAITDIVILTGYKHEKIEEYFQNGKALGVSIVYSYSPVEAETGTRVKNALPLMQDHFLLLYSDNYWPLDLNALTDFYEKKRKSMSVTVYANKDGYTKNNMLIEDGLVKVYDKSKMHPQLNNVDIGYFIIDKKILCDLPEGNFSFEKTIIPRQIERKDISAYVTYHKYFGLSNPQRVEVIGKFFNSQKVVFLDRDGVINKRAPKAEYIIRWDDFVILPNVKEALQLLKKKGYNIYIISNQPGIARKMVTREAVDEINQKFVDVAKSWGVIIDGVYICPHGWDEGCWCRKPSPGMLFQASYDHVFNLFESYCIGDDERDIVAGQAAHCKGTFLVTPENDLYTIVKKHL